MMPSPVNASNMRPRKDDTAFLALKYIAVFIL
jgi:hypothetical protein